MAVATWLRQSAVPSAQCHVPGVRCTRSLRSEQIWALTIILPMLPPFVLAAVYVALASASILTTRLTQVWICQLFVI